MRENYDIQPEFVEQQYTPEQEEFVLPPTVVADIVTPDASPATAGKIAIATLSEVNAGVNTAKAVTPETLADSVWGKRFSQNIGNGVLTQFDLTHNYNSVAVQVEVVENSGDFLTVTSGFTVKRTSVNIVRLDFSVAPAANEFKVIIR